MPIISVDGVPAQKPAETAQANSNVTYGNVPEGDIFNKIEQLAELKKKGILTEDEFASKKAELLKQI